MKLTDLTVSRTVQASPEEVFDVCRSIWRN
jgi:hypothetical protein